MFVAATLLAPLGASLALGGHAIGESVPRAFALHITNGGLAQVGNAVEALVPESIAVTGMTGETWCAEDDAQPLYYELGELEILLTVDEASLVASEGRLDLDVYGTLASTESQFLVQGDCSVLTDLDETCLLELPTTALSAHVGMTLEELDGTFDVTVDSTSVEMSPIGNPVSDCTLASAVGTLLGQDESAISDLVLSYVEPELETLPELIEEPLEEALDSLVMSTELTLGATPMYLDLEPTQVELGESGIILGFGATVDLEPSDCVDTSGGSEYVGAEWPDFAETVPGSALAYDAGVYLGRDFVDHLLYAVWGSGILCQEVSDLGGTAVSTSLFDAFMGESWAELFPEARPARLELTPDEPPSVVFDEDEPPLAVAVESLGIGFHTEMDARDHRLFLLDLVGEVGLTVSLEESDGLLSIAPEVLVDTDAIAFEESHNEFLPRGMGDDLAAYLPNLLTFFSLDDLLPAYEFDMPYGLGLDSVYWIPTEDDAWQGLYVLLDTNSVEPVDVGGCDAGGLGCGGGDTGDTGGVGLDLGDLGCDSASEGCGDSGCEGGSACSTTGGPRLPLAWSRLGLLGVLFGAAGLRRRRTGRAESRSRETR